MTLLNLPATGKERTAVGGFEGELDREGISSFQIVMSREINIKSNCGF